MNTIQLKQKLHGLSQELDVLANKAELSAEDQVRWDELYSQKNNIQRELQVFEQRDWKTKQDAEEKGINLSEKDKKDISKYSFAKAIQDTLQHGRPQGLEAEMSKEAEKELGNINQQISSFGVPRAVLTMPRIRADVTTATAPMVPTGLMGFIDALYAKMFIISLGAEVYKLTGPTSIPRNSTMSTVGWKTEVADADDAGTAFDDIDLVPKRLTCYQDLSKSLIRQSPYNIENIIQGLFIKGMAVALDNACIAGAANGPTGILATTGIGAVVGGTHGLAPTMAHLLDLIEKVAVQNADIGKLAFLTNPSVRRKLQTTPVVAQKDDTVNHYGWSESAQRIWPVDVADKLIGYNAAVTTQVPKTLDKGTSVGVCSAIIFGNWEENIVAEFGAIDITVDPLSLARANKVRIVLNSFWDHALRHPGSFAAMKDALTA